MKKIISVVLALVLICSACAAYAGNYLRVCRECGKEGVEGDYCSRCGGYSEVFYDEEFVNEVRQSTEYFGPEGRRLHEPVGRIVHFGHYEQDNDLGNGQEPIEWKVLDVKTGRRSF